VTDWLDRIHVGDCREVMASLPAESVHAIVTDPPYGIRFMGKAWDGADIERTHGLSSPNGRTRQRTGTAAAAAAGKYDLAPQAMRAFQAWTAAWAAEALRVLKPGGHLLSFASCRTYHRMASGLEDAGFEIRDQLAWVFGSGFPKSFNLEGAWDGWGTALKPAWEPIALARKPMAGTTAQNVAVYGSGALNINGCRVLAEGEQREPNTGNGGIPARHNDGEPRPPGPVARPHKLGRWPANILHDGSADVLAHFPDAAGQLAPITGKEPTGHGFSGNVYGGPCQGRQPIDRRDGGGSAARFFYCPKASKADRDDGLEAAPDQVLARSHQAQKSAERGEVTGQARGAFNDARLVKNDHPTVKPTELMRYLCRLVTPPGGTVLDPFAGSGSTLRGASLEGFHYVGVELDAHYVEIARRRVAATISPQARLL
jgi:DNA modification methylase